MGAIESARTFFDVVAARGHEPSLASHVGAWEIEVEGAGTWIIEVDHGALRVVASPGTSKNAPRARFRIAEDMLVRLANGVEHENLVTALLRGAASVEGEAAFAKHLMVLLPIPEHWSSAA
jgi:hypothetical protein